MLSAVRNALLRDREHRALRAPARALLVIIVFLARVPPCFTARGDNWNPTFRLQTDRKNRAATLRTPISFTRDARLRSNGRETRSRESERTFSRQVGSYWSKMAGSGREDFERSAKRRRTVGTVDGTLNFIEKLKLVAVGGRRAFESKVESLSKIESTTGRKFSTWNLNLNKRCRKK